MILQKEESGTHFKAFFERQTNDLLYAKKIVSHPFRFICNYRLLSMRRETLSVPRSGMI